MGRIVFLLILLSLSSKLFSQKEFFLFQFQFETNFAIQDIIVFRSDSLECYKKPRLFEYGIRDIEFQIFKWYILKSNLIQIKENYSIDEGLNISYYSRDTINCFRIEGKENACVFLHGLSLLTRRYHIVNEISERFSKSIASLIGNNAYRKNFGNIYWIEDN